MIKGKCSAVFVWGSDEGKKLRTKDRGRRTCEMEGGFTWGGCTSSSIRGVLITDRPNMDSHCVCIYEGVVGMREKDRGEMNL